MTARHRVLGLDMLRALAILLVMAAHFTNSAAAWFGFAVPVDFFFVGDVGIDIFFGLSGFLIGRIVLDVASRPFRWRGLGVFLVRRWMRTLPAYLAWLAILLAFFPPATGLVRYAAHFATLTQNLWGQMPVDYWFSVSWSLAVEEWFYLLFGTGTLVVAVLSRRPWMIVGPLVVLLVVPLALRLGVTPERYFHSGYWKMVPFRLDEICYGVILAWLGRRPAWAFDHPAIPALLGVVLVALGWVYIPPFPFHLFIAFRNVAVAVGGVLCIPLALRVTHAPAWVAAPARHLSRLSYTLYLVHLTVLVDVVQPLVFGGRVGAGTGVVLSVGATFAAAEMLSWLVEQPLMRLRPPQVAVAA